MESQSAFIRADGAVELHAVADVHLYFSLVVHPWYAESGDTLWLYEALYEFRLLKLGVLVIDINDRCKHLSYSLQILCFTWMLALQTLHYFLNFHSIVFLFKG